MEPEIEARAEGGEGPGHVATRGADPTFVTAIVFTVLGFTPDAFFDATVGYSHFGPLAWSAILAMVGVLFSVITFLRAIDIGDNRLRTGATVVFVIAMLRVFIVPLF